MGSNSGWLFPKRLAFVTSLLMPHWGVAIPGKPMTPETLFTLDAFTHSI